MKVFSKQFVRAVANAARNCNNMEPANQFVWMNKQVSQIQKELWEDKTVPQVDILLSLKDLKHWLKLNSLKSHSPSCGWTWRDESWSWNRKAQLVFMDSEMHEERYLLPEVHQISYQCIQEGKKSYFGEINPDDLWLWNDFNESLWSWNKLNKFILDILNDTFKMNEWSWLFKRLQELEA